MVNYYTWHLIYGLVDGWHGLPGGLNNFSTIPITLLEITCQLKLCFAYRTPEFPYQYTGINRKVQAKSVSSNLIEIGINIKWEQYDQILQNWKRNYNSKAWINISLLNLFSIITHPRKFDHPNHWDTIDTYNSKTEQSLSIW